MGIKVLKFFFFNQQSTFPLGQPSRPLNLVKINPGMLHVASLKYIYFFLLEPGACTLPSILSVFPSKIVRLKHIPDHYQKLLNYPTSI